MAKENSLGRIVITKEKYLQFQEGKNIKMDNNMIICNDYLTSYEFLKSYLMFETKIFALSDVVFNVCTGNT